MFDRCAGNSYTIEPIAALKPDAILAMTKVEMMP
jgi:hypothetical protein